VPNIPQTRSTPLPALLGDLAEFGFAEFHRRLNEAGHPSIRRGHGHVFRFIQDEGSRLTELAEHSGLTKQAVGEVVADLEGLGYVERAPDPGDRRAKLIRLTALGEEARVKGVEIYEQIEREWAERFGADRIQSMRELLEEARGGGEGARVLPFRPPSTPRTPPA
jgi:DNA-binding MarR family transcriptional regulator